MDRLVTLTVALAALATASSIGVGAWLTSQPRSLPRADSSMPDRQEILRRVEALEDRLRRQPEDVEGWKMLGRSYMALGRLKDAVSVYSQAAQLAPNDGEIRGALADLSARAGSKHDEAIKPK